MMKFQSPVFKTQSRKRANEIIGGGGKSSLEVREEMALASLVPPQVSCVNVCTVMLKYILQEGLSC
jgi:hypothetical protein